MVGRGGFEPPKSVTADLQSAPFGHSGTYPYEIWWAGDGTRTRNLLITNQLLCQLSYTSILTFSEICWVVTGTTHKWIFGGNNRARTYDPLLVRQMLSQLSYAPKRYLSMITHKVLIVKHFFEKKMVGVEGFEPPASWSQTTRATKLRQTPASSVAEMTTWLLYLMCI